MRIVLVGGGSGGHFYPLMSIAEELRAMNPSISLYYLGPEPYDQAALGELGIAFVQTGGGKRRRYASFLNVLDAAKTLLATIHCFFKLFVLYPDVIVSKGSYTSVPVILCAAFLRIPIVVHESDTRPGKANALAARFADTVAISFEEVRQYFNHPHVMFSGIPMRQALRAPVRPNAHALLGVHDDRPILFIVGGSQGAERINTLVLACLTTLLPRYTVVHQTGKAHHALVVKTAQELISDASLLAYYHAVPFIEDPRVLNDILHVASLVVSRAGTGSIYEIAIHGKPSILIPIPETISHDQRTNAYAYARSGGAVVIEEHNLTEHLLTSEIERIMQNPDIAAEMSSNALQFAPQTGGHMVADIAYRIAQKH